MPIHDWSKFGDWLFHNQQFGWAVHLSGMLNTGGLPKGFYSLISSLDFVEPASDEDESDERPPEPPDLSTLPGVFHANEIPPHVRLNSEVSDFYERKRKRIRIYRECDDQIVATIEILSPGNKTSRPAIDRIVKLIADELRQEHQVLVIDINMPTPCAPQGIHREIFAEFGDETYIAPADAPLTLAAYTSGHTISARVEPVGVRERLPPMPLFLAPHYYLMIPLEESYAKAFSGLPRHLQAELNATISPARIRLHAHGPN